LGLSQNSTINGANNTPQDTRYTTRQRAIKDYTIKTRNSRQRAASASHEIIPLKQEIQDKEQHRRATTSHRKSIPKEHDWEYQEGLIEDYDYDNVTWRYFRAALRHRFASRDACMAEWMNIQQSNTQYYVNERNKIIKTALDYNSGNGDFARSPTLLT
jgi:hypothetical protein